ncbi:hypothetical protein [Paraburkholderia bannensis]|uniref:hypothetical protein n=1 Tax=Paraburkholderia bannensis TaxID=765414 RepID=UPI000487CD69|nr:hypothetical protein [Paraburkholderia bannensis]
MSLDLSRLLKNVTFDALLAACFYLYLVYGITGAKFFIDVLIWFACVCSWIMVLSGRAREVDRPAPLNAAYEWVSSLAFVLALIWVGELLLPAAYCVGSLLYASLRGGKQSAQQPEGA